MYNQASVNQIGNLKYFIILVNSKSYERM